jgi:hypothetical protein
LLQDQLLYVEIKPELPIALQRKREQLILGQFQRAQQLLQGKEPIALQQHGARQQWLAILELA